MTGIGSLLQRISAAFPGLKWEKYELITEGWDHTVLILDRAIVFRFPNDDEYLNLLRREIEVLRWLHPQVQVNIPKYSFIAPDGSFAGYPIVPGETLTKAQFDELTPAQRSVIARKLAGLLTVMHTSPLDSHGLESLTKPYLKTDQDEVKQLMAKHLHEVLTPKELSIADKILRDIDALIEQPLPEVFVHGDIYSRHLLWDKSTGQLGVIDFSDMSRGDPAMDFGEIHEYGLDFVQQVYDLYAGPKDSTFMERAWKYQLWAGVYMMTDHFVYHKTSFAEARETFDRTSKLL